MTAPSLLLAASACLCGVAPERSNDFYWENDKFGMRAYGPGDYHCWSGLDVFNKMPASDASCARILHNPSKCGNWHKTPHKGVIDNYAVGAGRGLGGVALFGDGEWKTYPNWESFEIVTNADDRCEFKLVYPGFSALGRMTYRITLRKGERFFRNDVSFEFPDRIREFKVGPGIDVDPARGHGGALREDRARGVVTLFETSRGDVEGSTMTALMIDPKDADGVEFLTDRLGCRVLALRKPSFTYWAGAAWSKAGEITTPEAWAACVEGFYGQLNGKGKQK